MAMSKSTKRRSHLSNGNLNWVIYMFILGILMVAAVPIKNKLTNNFDIRLGGAAQKIDNDSVSSDSNWATLLVNRWNPIPKEFKPDLVTLSNGERIDKKISAPLQQMIAAAEAEGVFPIIASGYRSTAEQQKLLDNKIKEYQAEGNDSQQAIEKAESWVALPGTSEHQLGIAVDINENKWRSSSEKVYSWLQTNAHRFGFIYRYPSNKTEITGVINEPWHYRYVGIGPATEIYQRGICLEEYLENE